jgi:hypothetical protein
MGMQAHKFTIFSLAPPFFGRDSRFEKSLEKYEASGGDGFCALPAETGDPAPDRQTAYMVRNMMHFSNSAQFHLTALNCNQRLINWRAPSKTWAS